MADKKISALTSASTPLAGTEVLPIVQSGSTVKVSVENLTAGRAVATAGGSFTDNIVQSTAAKGVNFTANTPAAGMTSQLLNWYEEGTWTPAITSSGGAITSTSNASGNYTRIGNQVTIWFTIKITNNGTGSGYIKLTGIPFNLNSVGKTIGTGVDTGVSAKQLVIYGNTTTELIVTFYDSTYPGATNAVLVGCITYYV